MKIQDLSKNIPIYYFYNALGAGLFFVPIWVVYYQSFLTLPQMAFFNALFYIIIFLFELPTGAFADLVGRKYSMVLGSVVNALGFTAIAFMPNLTGMWLFIFGNGLGASLISGAGYSLVYDSLKEMDRTDEYPLVSAKSSLSFQIVAAFAVAVGGYVYQVFEGLPYLLRGILFMFSVIPGLLLIEPHIDSEKFTLRNYLKQTRDGFKEAFSTGYKIRLSILFVVVSGIAMSNQRFFTQPYLIENSVGDIERGWLAAGVKLFIALFVLLLASRKKFLKSKYFLLTLPIIMIASLLLAPFINNYLLLILVLIGIAIPSGGKSTLLGYPVQQQLRSKYRSTAISALNMFTSLVYALNNLIGGFVSENYSTGWYLFGVAVFILIFVVPLGLSLVGGER